MYCGKCGNEIMNNDSFCTKCGKKISSFDNIKINNESIIGMKWYNFYTYFILPLIIFINMFAILPSTGSITAFNLIFTLLWVIYIGITFALLLFKKKIGYYFNLAYLLITPITTFFSNISGLENESISYITGYIIGSGIPIAIWTIPNIVYFKKRKDLFT